MAGSGTRPRPRGVGARRHAARDRRLLVGWAARIVVHNRGAAWQGHTDAGGAGAHRSGAGDTCISGPVRAGVLASPDGPPGAGAPRGPPGPGAPGVRSRTIPPAALPPHPPTTLPRSP